MAIGAKEGGNFGASANVFDPVTLKDSFNTWRVRTNKILDTFTANTITTSNTTLSNGVVTAITHGHFRLVGDAIASNVYVNGGKLRGGQKGTTSDLTVGTNTVFEQLVTVSNNTVLGIDGEDETLFNSRIRATSNSLFTDIVRVHANVAIGVSNSSNLTVNSTSVFNGTANFKGDTNTDGSATFNGNTSIGSTNADFMTVEASTNFKGGIISNREVRSTGNVHVIGATLTVGGITSLNDAVTLGETSTNLIEVNGHLRTQGNAVFGNTPGNQMTVRGNAVFQANANFNNQVIISGNTSIGSDVNDTLTVNASSTFNSNATFTNIETTNDATIGNDLTVTDNIFIDTTKVVNGEGSTKFIQNSTANNIVLKSYSESLVSSSNTSNFDIDLNDGSVFKLTLDGDVTLTISNPKAGADSFTLILIQDGSGSRTVTYPASVKFQGGVTPTLSTGAGDIDMLTFVTYDGGTSYLGTTAGLDFS